MTPSACPLCGTLAAANLREVSDHDTGETFLIVRCTNCDHQFLSPAPRVEELERYYQSELTGGAMRRPPSDFVRGLQRIGLRRETALLRTLVQPHGGIVDLGAGDGALVQMLAESGYRAGACDFYPQEQWPGGSLPYAQVDLHGGRLTVADIHRPLGGAPAAVILRHVLEHLHEPQKVLSTIAESGARFIQITVPNAASPMARWFGSNWYYWDPPRHLQFFTPQTLRAACESSGFRLRASGTAGLDEVVTSLHRFLRLKNVMAGTRILGAGALIQLTRPKGLLSALASIAQVPFGSAVCWCLAENIRLASDAEGGRVPETTQLE